MNRLVWRQFRRVSTGLKGLVFGADTKMSSAQLNSQTKSPFSLIRQFARDFLRIYAGSCIGVGILMVLCVLLQLPIPMLTMYIIDHTVSARNVDLLTEVALLLAALVVAKHVFSYFNETLTLRLKENIILEIQKTAHQYNPAPALILLFRQTLHLSPEQGDERFARD